MATVYAEDEEEIATARVEAKNAAEDEFEAEYLQGYIDLKRRVALVHLVWDLSTLSGVNSD